MSGGHVRGNMSRGKYPDPAMSWGFVLGFDRSPCIPSALSLLQSSSVSNFYSEVLGKMLM